MIRLLFVSFILLGSNLFAKENSPIKLAILDNLQSQKLSSQKYEQDYLEGLNLALERAEKKGIKFEHKNFFYNGKVDLSILEQIEKVKAWKPDIVIGPRSSNKFLVLEKHFKGVLVLSPLATASEVSKMPDNFYSISLPNEYGAIAMANLINRDFEGKTLFKIIEADYSYSVDFAKQLENNLGRSIPGTQYLRNDVEKIGIEKLLNGYKKGSLIVLPNSSYASGVLMGRISDFLKKRDIVFLGGDSWGSWKASYTGKVKSKFNYIGYRMSPWTLEGKSKDILVFKKDFQKKFKKEPTGTISYIAYQTLNSITDVLKNKKGGYDREGILKSYQKTLNKNPNWYRPVEYAVFKLNQNGEEFVGFVSALKSSKLAKKE